jgi:hypothetical protein
MKKIKEITVNQFEKLRNSEDQAKVFKEIVNLKQTSEYKVGDTTVKVEGSKPLDVFKNTFKGKDTYYIVINTLDEQMAFAYSLYPILG